jgi:valyl-tRNA synthetase
VDTTERDSYTVVGVMTATELRTLPLPERYIVSACHQLIDRVTLSLENYDFGDAGRQIYEFLWDEYADWYIEISKTRMRTPALALQARRTLVYVWDSCLRLLHPFMPFLTEVLWQQLPHRGDSLMIANWPKMVDELLLIP